MKDIFTYEQEIPLHLGSLSRENALLCLKIKANLEEIIKKHNHLIYLEKIKFLLAISGGIDSIAMLIIFLALQKKYTLNFQVVHFNHLIRAESNAEQIMIQKICQKFHINFHYQETDVISYAKNNHLGLEEAGRILRYDFFEKIRAEINFDYICTAHHADDLAEDIIMRLIRGTATFAGMKNFCPIRKIVRPLLEEKKESLKKLVLDTNFLFSEDQSNQDEQFLRNRVRKNIIPLFIKENPNFINIIKNLHKNCEEDNDFFSEQIMNFLNKYATYEHKNISIPIIHLEQKHKALRMKIYAHLILKYYKSFSNYNTLEKLDLAIITHKNNTIFKFSQNIRAKISDKKLIFYHN